MATNNPFEFLEKTLTSQSLEALKATERDTRRRMQQSMTANEKSGFGVGTMLFGALSSAFGPGKKRRELAQQGDAALQQSAAALEAMPEESFSGPHGGLKRNLARSEALVQAFQEQGLQEDAMRAQIAANNFRTQLEEAEQKRTLGELTVEGRELTNEQTRLANEANRQTGVLNRQTYFLDPENNEIVDRLDASKGSYPMRQQRLLQQNPNILPLSRTEYLRWLEQQSESDAASAAADADFELLTKHDFAENRDTLVAQNNMLGLGNRMMEIWQNAEGNPLTTAAAAERFGNRVAQELDQVKNFYNANLAQAQQAGVDVSEEARTSDVRRWMQERGIERQMSASLLQRLTWTLTRQFNGARPTDRDYERIYNMLGGDAGDPALAATAMDELFGLDTRNHIDSYGRLLSTENDAGRRYGDTVQGRVLQRELDSLQENWSQFSDRFDSLQQQFRHTMEDQPASDAPSDPNSFFDGAFSIGGPQ